GAQDSQFAALSAVVTGADESSVFEVDEAALDRLDQLDEQESAPDAGLELPLPALPGSAPTPDAIVLAGRVTPRERRAELRERNSKLVQEIVWLTGLTHAQVNARLNREVGVRRIDEATLDQLAR